MTKKSKPVETGERIAPTKKSRTLQVRFGAVGLKGRGTARVGVTMLRGSYDPTELDSFLTDSMFNATILVDPAGDEDVEGQTKIMDTSVEVKSPATCSGFRCSADAFAFGISLTGLERDQLSALQDVCNHDGKLKLQWTGAVQHEAEEEDDEETPNLAFGG